MEEEVHSNKRENFGVNQIQKEYIGRPLVTGEASEQW
jgi:hypothetical protein